MSRQPGPPWRFHGREGCPDPELWAAFLDGLAGAPLELVPTFLELADGAPVRNPERLAHIGGAEAARYFWTAEILMVPVRAVGLRR